MPLSNYNLNASANNNNNNNNNNMATTATTTTTTPNSLPKANSLKINNFSSKEVEVAEEDVVANAEKMMVTVNSLENNGSAVLVFNGNGTIGHLDGRSAPPPLPYEHLLVVTPGGDQVDNNGEAGGGDQ